MVGEQLSRGDWNGDDTIKLTAAWNLTLTDSSLRGVSVDFLDTVERAVLTITETVGRVVDASAFSGRVTIHGGSGADTILGSMTETTLTHPVAERLTSAFRLISVKSRRDNSAPTRA